LTRHFIHIRLPLTISTYFHALVQLRAFNLIPDVINQGSTTTAVFEFEDPAASERAIQGLHGISFGASKVALQRVPQAMAAALLQPAATLAAAGPSPAPPSSAPPAPASATSAASASALLASMPATAALQLSNMVTVEDLTDDELFAELTEDVADECNKYGAVRSINMPRPRLPVAASGHFDPSDVAAGVGRIFVLFASEEATSRARAAVHGRSFNGRKVEAVYFPEEFVTAKVCLCAYCVGISTSRFLMSFPVGLYFARGLRPCLAIHLDNSGPPIRRRSQTGRRLRHRAPRLM
jgi:splicing factor U2AF subunit